MNGASTEVHHVEWRAAVLERVPDLLSALPDPRGFVWLHRGTGFVAWGRAASVDVGTGADRFTRASEGLERVFDELEPEDGALPIALGSFSFDPGGNSSLVVPGAILQADEAGTARLHWAGRTSPDIGGSSLPTSVPKIRYAGSTISEIAWLEAVDAAVREISARGVDKVVLARDLLVWAREPLDRRLLAARLERRFPECFVFAFDELVGATPELLVRRTGRAVESLVLAGSARRSPDAHVDEDIGHALLASAKDVAEHRFAVESVTDVLSEVCSALTTEGPYLLKLANLQHLATRVRGTATGSHTALEMAGLLHPTAAVCGTPRAAAMAMIRRLEGMDRARYGGPVGWVDANGDGEFGIALRCAEIDGTRARLFAGNGIVGDSKPEAELEETRLKLRAMQHALGEVP